LIHQDKEDSEIFKVEKPYQQGLTCLHVIHAVPPSTGKKKPKPCDLNPHSRQPGTLKVSLPPNPNKEKKRLPAKAGSLINKNC
jgi:hypothetical protein